MVFQSMAVNLVPGDSIGADIFIKDIHSGEIRMISADSNGNEGNDYSDYAAISADGRYAAFFSAASNLVPGDSNGCSDIFVTGNFLADWSVVRRNQWLDISARELALIAQDELDGYLVELNQVEGDLGASEARIGTALNNLRSMTENYKAAAGRISDADIAEESAKLIKTQILQEAGLAILAQANLQPGIAMRLIAA